MNKKDKLIKRLSYDRMFGILTRNALEVEVEKSKNLFNCIWIDINNFGLLNSIIGYDKANDLIKSTFEAFEFKSECIIGRWFSGDEILIVHDRPELIIYALKEVFRNKGLSFKSHIYYNIDAFEELVKKLSQFK